MKKIIPIILIIIGLVLIGIFIYNDIYVNNYVIGNMIEADSAIEYTEAELVEQELEPLPLVFDDAYADTKAADKNDEVTQEDTSNSRAAEAKKASGLHNPKIVSSDDHEVEPLTRENYEKYREAMKRAVRSGRLIIPKINMNLGIYQGLHNAHMNKGAAEQLPRSVQKMGQPGNYILASHKATFLGALFNRIHELNPGDLMFLSDNNNLYVYGTQFSKKIHVSETDYINEETDEALITMYTCINTWGSKSDRTIVRGKLVDIVPVNNIPAKYQKILGNYTYKY